MAKLVTRYSFLLPQLTRSIFTTTPVDIRSGGFGQSVTPKVTRRDRGRFAWGCRARWFAPTFKIINGRRDNVTTDEILRYGSEKIPRRSDFTDWNYNSELYAFQARIGEKFDDLLLTTAFVTPAFLEAEQARQKELGLTMIGDNTNSISTRSNASLAITGVGIVTQTLRTYLNFALPDLPADGVEAFVNFLTTDKMLAHVSFLIGTKDLLLCEEYPPSEHNMAQTFLALVAALKESSGIERVVRFILDILATQLNGVDLSEIWNVQNPMSYLAKVLKTKGMAEPESRLLWCGGKETIFACYHVGIFSNKELIGQAPGETTGIAEEMAALDALRRIFNITDSSKPLPFGKYVHDEIPKLVEEKINVKKLSQ